MPPPQPAKPPAPKALPLKANAKALPRVLLLEPDPHTQSLMLFFLREKGYPVSVATETEGAFKILDGSDKPHDIILTAWSLLDGEPHAFLRRIRQNVRHAATSILILAPVHDERAKTLGLELGADDFLLKPFRMEEFMARITTLTRLWSMKQVVKNDLQAAHKAQEALLPRREFTGKGFSLAAFYQAADLLGGDFFDFRQTADGQALGLIIADVSGHGVSAAFTTSITKLAFQNAFQTTREPDKILLSLNHQLAPFLKTQFITAFCLVYTPKTRTLHYAGAGHPPLLLKCARKGVFQELAAQSLFLGPFPDLAFPSESLKLEPGDMLFAYTDGITETQDPQGKPFRLEGLREALTRHGALPLTEQLQAVMKGLDGFRKNKAPQDDCALLALQV